MEKYREQNDNDNTNENKIEPNDSNTPREREFV